MYSASDFEKLWFLYKTEGEPNGIPINSFCVTHGVSYTHFNDWFRKIHKKIVPVQIDGKPSEECDFNVIHMSEPSSNMLLIKDWMNGLDTFLSR